MPISPQQGEFWRTPKDRTVEILATLSDDDREEIEVIAYRFLGGSQVRLSYVILLTGWKKEVL